MTLCEAVVERLRAAARAEGDGSRPLALLWTDESRGWEPGLPLLREAMPELLTLGDYDPARRSGPAIYLRCLVARTLPEAGWDAELTPVVYLPGLGRSELRAVEGHGVPLRLLSFLRYAGAIWGHPNGRDWTVRGLLGTSPGLGLDVADGPTTRDALSRNLPKLLPLTLDRLRALEPLAAAGLDDLDEDWATVLLDWMQRPKETRAALGGRWNAFRSHVRARYDLDPQTDGELAAAERLARRGGAWEPLWRRFAHTPAVYAGLPPLLRRAKPRQEDLFAAADRSAFPQDNEADERALRDALRSLENRPDGEARATVRSLEAAHGGRRESPWARLGEAPLALALRSLVALAEATEKPLSPLGERGWGEGLATALANSYAEGGWRADGAACDALAAVRGEDRVAVAAAVRSLYAPWLAAGATAFQAAELPPPQPPESPRPGEAWLFADGLRMDVARRLEDRLRARGHAPSLAWRFAAHPGVTATAKPAASPLAERFYGTDPAETFLPRIAGDDRVLSSERFKALLREAGLADAWSEAGSLDRRGHDEGAALAGRVEEEVTDLADRVESLLAAGWRRVRVVTDHGWLLMPGGLPKVELPAHLAETRWGRCAVLRDSADVRLPSGPWRWNPDVAVASAPGIGNFYAGVEYAHGGLSPQECVTPVIVIEGRTSKETVRIEEAAWTGMRLRARVEGAEGLAASLWTKLGDPSSALVEARAIAGGKVSLLVPDDGQDGVACFLVILDGGGVVARMATTVGGEER